MTDLIRTFTPVSIQVMAAGRNEPKAAFAFAASKNAHQRCRLRGGLS